MRRGLLLLLAWLPALSPGARAQPSPELSVIISPQELTVGDRVEITLTLAGLSDDLDGEPLFPDWGRDWGAAELLSVGDVEETNEDGKRRVFRQRVIATAFHPGEIRLPPVEVVVSGVRGTRTLTSADDLTLTVRSLVPPAAVEPRPPSPPRSLPLHRAFWITTTILAALCVAGGVTVRRELQVESAASPQPLAQLLAELSALASEIGVEELHTRLSLALRRYLASALRFQALESTTSEIHRELRKRDLPTILERRCIGLLRSCDRVKFGRQLVEQRLLKSRLSEARQIGLAFERRRRPAEGRHDLDVNR